MSFISLFDKLNAALPSRAHATIAARANYLRALETNAMSAFESYNIELFVALQHYDMFHYINSLCDKINTGRPASFEGIVLFALAFSYYDLALFKFITRFPALRAGRKFLFEDASTDTLNFAMNKACGSLLNSYASHVAALNCHFSYHFRSSPFAHRSFCTYYDKLVEASCNDYVLLDQCLSNLVSVFSLAAFPINSHLVSLIITISYNFLSIHF